MAFVLFWALFWLYLVIVWSIRQNIRPGALLWAYDACATTILFGGMIAFSIAYPVRPDLQETTRGDLPRSITQDRPSQAP